MLRHQISKSHINAGGASNMPTAVIVVIDGNKANAKERKDVLQIVADLQIATPKPGEIIAPNVLALADTLPVFSMSLRTSGHTCGNPFSPQRNLALLWANSYVLFRIRPKYYFLLCPAAGVTDCHVASLLAMTC